MARRSAGPNAAGQDARRVAPALQEANALALRLATWGAVWGVPDLAETVQLRLSARLKRAWARTSPARSLITLSPSLLAAQREVLERVLCHEAAHVAAYRLHGPCAPHGREWRELVRKAGFPPTLRLPSEDASSPKRRTARFEHRCPVCQVHCVARRRMQGWRCTACTKAGLPGHLTITRLPEPL